VIVESRGAMHLIRARVSEGDRVFRQQPDGTVLAVGAIGDISELLRLPLADIERLCQSDDQPDGVQPTDRRSIVDGRMEVWAAGVTYKRSRTARAEESSSADVYERVYDADRPELFFKSVAWRVVVGDEPIGVRADSPINVPEPELAVVANSRGEIVGYTVCNDVSSRSIEGENPLYLPQAKVYDASCAVAAAIRPAWEVADPYALAIEVVVERDGTPVWEARGSTALLNRRLPDLVGYLYRSQTFPDGAVLSTGTPLVPELTFNLAPGDVVGIVIQDVGQLRNQVVEIGAAEGGR
jgi:2-dehydro-3-deoxy-D-arabinonate dehydratase